MSTTNCTAKADQKFMVNFNVKCNPADDGKSINWTPTGDDCSLTFSTESKHGCETINLQFLEKFRMFIGAFEILGGLALVFVGARFIKKALQFLAFLLIALFTMGLGNIFFPLGGVSKVPLIATTVVALILGCVGGYLFKELIDKFGTMLLAGVGGLMVGLMIVSPFGMTPWLKYLILIACAGAAAYFGKTYKN